MDTTKTLTKIRSTIQVPAYLRISKSTLIAICFMAVIVAMISSWAYYYTWRTHPSYVCGKLGLGNLSYEKEMELVTEEMDYELVNGYCYRLHFQGISPEGYKVLIERAPQWLLLGQGKYYASDMFPARHSAGNFYAQTDTNRCTLTYTSYLGNLTPVRILWCFGFLTAAALALSLAVVLLSIGLKSARGVSWPSNFSSWRGAFIVSLATFIMIAIAIYLV